MPAPVEFGIVPPLPSLTAPPSPVTVKPPARPGVVEDDAVDRAVGRDALEGDVRRRRWSVLADRHRGAGGRGRSLLPAPVTVTVPPPVALSPAPLVVTMSRPPPSTSAPVLPTIVDRGGRAGRDQAAAGRRSRRRDEPVTSTPPPLWTPVIVVAPVTVKLPPTPARSIAPPVEPVEAALFSVTLSVPPWSMSMIWPAPDAADVGDGRACRPCRRRPRCRRRWCCRCRRPETLLFWASRCRVGAAGGDDGRPERAVGDADQDLVVEQVDAVRLGIGAGAREQDRRCGRPAARPACPAPR